MTMEANGCKYGGRKAIEKLRKWEAYGLGFNADYNVDGYVCIGSDVSLYDTEDIAEFVMNTPPPPSGPYYYEMSLNDRLEFGYSGRPYIFPSEYRTFIEQFPKYEKSFLKHKSTLAFRKRSMKALSQYIDYIRKKDGCLIIDG